MVKRISFPDKLDRTRSIRCEDHGVFIRICVEESKDSLACGFNQTSCAVRGRGGGVWVAIDPSKGLLMGVREGEWVDTSSCIIEIGLVVGVKMTELLGAEMLERRLCALCVLRVCHVLWLVCVGEVWEVFVLLVCVD